MISKKLDRQIRKDGKKHGYEIESFDYPAYKKDGKLRFVITLVDIEPIFERKRNQLEEFDLLTCSGFDELFQLVKLRNIELDNDTIAILFKRLIDDFPFGAYDGKNFRCFLENLVHLIRVREHENE